jgi:hypothetical protein
MALYTEPIVTESSNSPVKKYAVTILTAMHIILHVNDFTSDRFLVSLISSITNIMLSEVCVIALFSHFACFGDYLHLST